MTKKLVLFVMVFMLVCSTASADDFFTYGGGSVSLQSRTGSADVRVGWEPFENMVVWGAGTQGNVATGGYAGATFILPRVIGNIPIGLYGGAGGGFEDIPEGEAEFTQVAEGGFYFDIPGSKDKKNRIWIGDKWARPFTPGNDHALSVGFSREF